MFNTLDATFGPSGPRIGVSGAHPSYFSGWFGSESQILLRSIVIFPKPAKIGPKRQSFELHPELTGLTRSRRFPPISLGDVSANIDALRLQISFLNKIEEGHGHLLAWTKKPAS